MVDSEVTTDQLMLTAVGLDKEKEPTINSGVTTEVRAAEK